MSLQQEYPPSIGERRQLDKIGAFAASAAGASVNSRSLLLAAAPNPPTVASHDMSRTESGEREEGGAAAAELRRRYDCRRGRKAVSSREKWPDAGT